MRVAKINFGQNFNSNKVNCRQSPPVAFTHPIDNQNSDSHEIVVNRRGIIRFVESQIQEICEKISDLVMD